MNPGVLSMLVAAMLMVLFATGWKREIMDQVPASMLVLFVFGWFIFLHSSNWNWNGVEVNGSYVLALLTAVAAWMLTGNSIDRLHALSVAFLIAAIYVFLVQLYRTSPVLVVYNPTSDLAVIAAAAAVIFCRRSLEQWTVLTLGLWLGDALLTHVWEVTSKPRLGAHGLYDLWWLAFALARLFSVVAQRFYTPWYMRVKKWAGRRG